jgi:hypothetical protein
MSVSQKWAEYLVPLYKTCPKLYNKSLFPAFIMSLYLAFMGKWSNLADGISGVWALGAKLQFQTQSSKCSLVYYVIL